MSVDYTLALLRRGPRAEWSRLMPFGSDAEAIAAAGRIAETEGRRSPEPVSLMVGRCVDEGLVDWLGGWDRDAEGALCWDELGGDGPDQKVEDRRGGAAARRAVVNLSKGA